MVRHVHLNETEPVPVAPRAVPFDVDLGPGADGRVVAVYSRCAREPQIQGGAGVLPLWASGRGCDLYQFDFSRGTETKISGASTPRASEFLPSIWRERVTFARIYENREGKRGSYPYLYLRRIGSEGSKRLPGGPRGDTGLPGPTGLDLYGRRLTFAWTLSTGGEQPKHSQIRLDTLGANHVVIDTKRAGLAGRILVSPGIVKGRIHWAQQMLHPGALGRSEPEAFYRRYSISTGRTEEAQVPPAAQFVLSLGPSGAGELIYGRVAAVDRGAETACAAANGCEVGISGPLSWHGQ
jgi:hypothetical protein